MKKLLIIAMSLMIFSSCTKESSITNKIDGNWIVESTNVPETYILGDKISGQIILGKYNEEQEQGSLEFYQGSKEVKSYYRFATDYKSVYMPLVGSKNWKIDNFSRNSLELSEVSNNYYYKLRRVN
jgi:hypothetical protein